MIDGVDNAPTDPSATPALANRLADALYTEALLLFDEARGYFDGQGRDERDRLHPRERVLFACEALKANTRLMQLIGWLTARRLQSAREPLPPAADSHPETLALLPTTARRLVLAGIELHGRARRLAAGEEPTVAAISPARGLMARLDKAF